MHCGQQSSDSLLTRVVSQITDTPTSLYISLLQARAYSQLPATSTGPGLGTSTLRSLGADLPYDLVETPELGTIGVTLRWV
jgi:hypothetical protein